MASINKLHFSELRDSAALSLSAFPGRDIQEALREMTEVSLPISEKYQKIDAESVIRINKMVLPGLSTAFNILEKYGRNLMNPNKPKYWRTVKFNNPVFKTTVDAIQGGRDVLRLYGYTQEQKDGLSFPDTVVEPNVASVALVTLEVMMLRLELDLLIKGIHPNPDAFDHLIEQESVQTTPFDKNVHELKTSIISLSEQTDVEFKKLPTPLHTSGLSLNATILETRSPGECSVCGVIPEVSCSPCGAKLFCYKCDSVFHRHPVRADHQREPIVDRQNSCTLCGIDRVSAYCGSCEQWLCLECDERYHMHPSRTGHQRYPVINNMIPPGGSSFNTSGSLFTNISSSPPKVLQLKNQELQQPMFPIQGLGASQQISGVSFSQTPSLLTPWQCSACPTLNEGRSVLCVSCERPRACKTAPPNRLDSSMHNSLGTSRFHVQEWSCQACTMLNSGSTVLCQACERPRLSSKPLTPLYEKPAETLPSDIKNGWSCSHCTFWNIKPGRICVMCDRTSQDTVLSLPESLSFSQDNLATGKKQDLPSTLHSSSKKTPPSRPAASSMSNAFYGQDEADIQRQENMKTEGLKLVTMIREGESRGVSPEEVFAAVQYSGTDKPSDWLASELPLVLDTLSKLAAVKMEDARLSQQESVSFWIEAGGDLEKAVKNSVAARKSKIHEIQTLGFHNEKEIITALQVNGGDVSKAVIELQRHLLAPFHERIWQEDPDFNFHVEHNDRQRVLRRILSVFELPSWGRAELVLSLMLDRNASYSLEDVVYAVRESPDKDFIKRMLAKDCPICLSQFPQNRMQALTSCQCSICNECFQQHFTIVVKEKNIKDMACPVCEKPEINDESELNSYFSTLDIQLRECLNPDVYELFHKKLTERALMKDPKFLWCCHCSYGFIYDGNQLKVTCTQCRKSFCAQCKKPWEDQHQGLSCEDFQSWKRENDPEYQREGLAGYLKENGIHCPNCRFCYALSKGGCMHFRCTQCRYEFCSGCNNPFLKAPCPVQNCPLKNGLHAHHPRDCLSYLRDWDVEKLQRLLQTNKVPFNTDPPPGSQAGHCRVMEQKETPERLVDEPCGKDPPEHHAGLCINHYKEYLVSLINGFWLDPAPFLSLEELVAACKRYHVENTKLEGEDDKQYIIRLRQKLMDEVPLGDKVPRRK
ncbi:E3 ubiquitin-protein ligase RNF31-like [Erpetoichthys calabaricus]|uniref:RBR-type E3 ubiquitin transferase n=1 Tax=Erpetoichthys calabaricus TaxID=27687 RepID=A0A8C4XAZ1_ERPCA|nr:E3 ubiquitin-protein ligase RNF31-like [Erpetoichthys calabaricus]